VIAVRDDASATATYALLSVGIRLAGTQLDLEEAETAAHAGSPRSGSDGTRTRGLRRDRPQRRK